MGPFVQYATEKLKDPIEIRIVTGADGRFTLYEDANDGYEYEDGEFATIDFDWDDVERSLTISARIGEFDGMSKERVFNIVLVEKARVSGIQPLDQPDREVDYRGDVLTVKF
jgi:alpha-D-xyloside xylohydrolase